VSTSPAQLIESEPCHCTGAPHRLIQRPDDNEATVAERLRVYEEKTRPLIEFYRARGLLRIINAEGGVEEVTDRLEQALHAVPRSTTTARGTARRKSRRPAARRSSKSASGSKRKRAAGATRAAAAAGVTRAAARRARGGRRPASPRGRARRGRR
jgi:hypothetical protein